ncbi:hypothetical protein, partial [uncultured Desulfovibrio sp.]|uniref:hypothetical protein n=1 Tax=uncultured Desulfovibrio sp. TaxID=167968 RepID=UPI002621B401
MGGITNKTVHLSFAVDWSKEVNPLLTVSLFSVCISRSVSLKDGDMAHPAQCSAEMSLTSSCAENKTQDGPLS